MPKFLVMITHLTEVHLMVYVLYEADEALLMHLTHVATYAEVDPLKERNSKLFTLLLPGIFK